MYWQCLYINSQCLFIYGQVWTGYMLPVYVLTTTWYHQCMLVYIQGGSYCDHKYIHALPIYILPATQSSKCLPVYVYIQTVTITSKSCPYLNGPWKVCVQANKTAHIYTCAAQFLYVVGLSNKQWGSSPLVWNSCFRQASYSIWSGSALLHFFLKTTNC